MTNVATIADKTGLTEEVVSFAMGWRAEPNKTWDPEGWSGMLNFSDTDREQLGVVGRKAHEALRIHLNTCRGDGVFYEMGYAGLEGPLGEATMGFWENA